ncbi:hypothetical protein [Saliniramus sp.]|uniref:hypothetical protein n=1 Tax=Saliniramus sp. TaxID=2986772 RepID=UPI002C3D1A74|nr:hypothetical protein [Saliniramus sp.]HMB10400.1 hypothetical protein [Saliniramus sp.]
MSDSKALTPVAEADYDAIEGAVMETERGRWFLKEYARRNRAADTQMLLGAIERLEGMMVQNREAQEKDRLRMDLLEMSRAISRTKHEISTLRPQGAQPNELGVASEALDAIVRTTERATSDILEAAEQIQEAAWTLREEGASEAMCDELDRRATDIYTACSFQDLTAQRTTRIVDTLRFLEGRINAMIEIWGDGETGEAPDGGHEGAQDGMDDAARQRDLSDSLEDFNGLCQDGIDTMIVDDAMADPVDAYFFNRGAEAEPPRLAEEIDFVADPAAADTAIAAAEADEADESVSDANGVVAGLSDLDDAADLVDFAEIEAGDGHGGEREGQAALTAETEAETDVIVVDADETGSQEPVSADISTGPLPDIDALPAREKLRRFS